MFRLTRKIVSNFGQIEQAITAKLTQSFNPQKLIIHNESHLHTRGTQTHFNVLIISEQFKDLPKVKQHQLVYTSLGDIMTKIHALTITCYSEQNEKTKGWSLGCFHSKTK